MGDLMGLAEDAAPLRSSQQKDVYRESNHKETGGKPSKSRDSLQNSQTLPKGQGHIKGDKTWQLPAMLQGPGWGPCWVGLP